MGRTDTKSGDGSRLADRGRRALVAGLARLLPGRALALLHGDARGAAGERVAARLLARAGWRVLGLRVRTAEAELDVVAVRDRTLVVLEVKTGRAGPRFRPGDRVTRRDLARRARAARALARRAGAERWRVDVAEVVVGPPGSSPRVLWHADVERFAVGGRPPWEERLPWGVARRPPGGCP